jgi:hypothetical protein
MKCFFCEQFAVLLFLLLLFLQKKSLNDNLKLFKLLTEGNGGRKKEEDLIDGGI